LNLPMESGGTEIVLRIRVTRGGAVVMGPGRADLLDQIQVTGSIAAAGRAMRMSYKRAWALVEAMNQDFTAPLVEAAKGGAGGGGARLTALGVQVLGFYLAGGNRGSAAGGNQLDVAGMITDLPNMLTLSRIGAIPLLVLFVAWGEPWTNVAAAAIFTVAGITDYLDGRLAREMLQLSDLGRMLDPIADKLLIGATLMALVGFGHLPGWGIYPAIVIMLREILVSGLREYLAEIRVGLPVTKLAKWKTGVQMVALGLLLLGGAGARILGLGWLPMAWIGGTLLWIAAALTLITGWDYLIAGLRHVTASRPAA
jgi:cardiolipin synthase